MFIVFGWLKDTEEAGSAFDCYCYRCHRQRMWERWKETEWVTFFTVKTIPFLNKTYLLCPACRDPILLDSAHTRLLDSQAQLPELTVYLEELQLAKKTDVQRTYLLAQRQRGELRK